MTDELNFNPFAHGIVVSAKSFVGRLDSLRSICSKLASGQSVALVGLHGAGKSALLNKLLSLQPGNGGHSPHTVFLYIDCMELASDGGLIDLWRFILSRLEIQLSDQWPDLEFHVPYDEDALRHRLGTFFERQVQRRGLRVVLLLDEFDVLLDNKVLQGAGFLPQLRSLLNRPHQLGLSAVIATQTRIGDLQDKNYAAIARQNGSPVFNHLQYAFLGPMSESECKQLIHQSLGSTPVIFEETDIDFISDMSGRLPKLICLIASGLFDVLSLDYREDDLYGRVIEHLEEDLRSYFQNIWQFLNGDHRCALIISAIKTILQARRVENEMEYISYQNITQDTAFLSRLGLLDDNSHILLGPQIFVYFIIFDILYKERELAHSFRDFLRRIGLHGWALQSHSGVLERAMQEIPWGLRGNSSDFIVWLMSQSETGHSTGRAHGGTQHWSDRAVSQIETRWEGSELVPTGPSLRRILDSAFPNDGALVAFCVDYFPEVAKRLGQGMDTLTKQTLLLQSEEARRIWGAVRDCVPEQTLTSLVMQNRVEWQERTSA